MSAVASPEVAVRRSEQPRLHPVLRARELFRARQILGNLVRKEVKVKYASSILGAAWSMLNPLLYLGVFSLVFSLVLRNDVPNYAVYLLSGLLAWNLFGTSLSLASRSVVDNASLVTKVYFPREVLPLSSIGAASVDFGLQALVLVIFMAVSRYGFIGLNVLLLPLSLVALFAFTCALSLWVASLNVRYRDTQHLLNLGLTLWFWLTPIIYPSGLLYETLSDLKFLGIPVFSLVLANPMAPIVMGFQRALYAHVAPTVVSPTGAVTHAMVLPPVSVGWLAAVLGGVTAISLVLAALAWRTFFHLSGDFAEEL